MEKMSLSKLTIMEQLLKISTSDKKVIYGRLRGSVDKPLVVFVHGLGGRMDQHIFYNGARFLEKNGVSSFRFNLYSWEKDARKLSECTLETHSYDLDRVIEYFRKKGTKKIFVVGHSFGGPTILLSKKKDFDGVILWDPSYGDPLSFENPKYVPSLGMYKVTWEFDVLINKAMIEEAKTLKEREEKEIRKLSVPIKIITAEEGWLTEGGKKYYQLANEPKEYVVIESAKHTFDEDGVEDKLLKETLGWIKKNSFD